VHAEERIDIGHVIGAELAAHQVPVRIEFFGKDHRQCRLDALAELQAVDCDRNLSIGRDLDKCRGLLGRLQAGCRIIGVGRLRDCQIRENSDGQTDGPRELEKAAARHRLGRC
jgi:hypothetical protein